MPVALPDKILAVLLESCTLNCHIFCNGENHSLHYLLCFFFFLPFFWQFHSVSHASGCCSITEIIIYEELPSVILDISQSIKHESHSKEKLESTTLACTLMSRYIVCCKTQYAQASMDPVTLVCTHCSELFSPPFDVR